MSRKRWCSLAAGAVTGAALLISAFAASHGPDFVADYTFTGSSLAGWHTLGDANWKAENGVIIGTPKQAGGGWLVLDRSLANLAFYADIHCSAGSKAAVLLRAEATPEGRKGILVSVTEGDLNSYAVKLNSQGKELSRDKLAVTDPFYVGGLVSAMGNSTPEVRAAAGKLVSRGNPGGQLPPGIDLPRLKAPAGEYRPGDWNELGLTLYGDSLKPILNGGYAFDSMHLPPSLAPLSAAGVGPVALYVGGSGEVRFRNVRYKDLNARTLPPEQVSPNFRMLRLNDLYYSWSAAVADINHDGIPDVVAGPYYYLGPDYRTAREIYMPVAYNPASEYPQTSMVNFAADFTGDGWPDVLVMSGNAGYGVATLYVNPKGESRHWDKYVVIQPVGNEDTLLADIDGDGRPEVIHSGDNTLRYSKPDPANPTGTWITTTISEPGPWGMNIGHGVGVGDINGDGLMDYVSAYGWWEQPAKGSNQKLWNWHPQEFGRWGRTQGGPGGAQLGVYDVNGDGLNDVVASLEGHGYGLAWYEQKRDAAGRISFVEHMIMDNFLTRNAGGVTFTEPHAVAFADIDGDGIPDLITGKRAMSHLFGLTDPDPFGAPVLYVYRVVRNAKAPGGAEFVPELVHNRSGVGSHFAVADLNADGKPDIITSAINGTFIFFNNHTR
jgi:hypothetical protein